ncbi:MAG: gluconate 2-dehydrogenase subunit 3 family protein, partial [Acidobacteriota bacterium]
KSGGALEANAPEFIDLLTSENTDYQTRLGGGINWLDAYCRKQYGNNFLGCSAAQQKEVLDLIAYRKNSTPQISQGLSFFSFLRAVTADGFYSSKIGIEDVGYIGNTALSEFPGCPEPTDA